MKSHAEGRKHKKLLQAQNKRAQSQKCSIYVRGFASTVTNLEDELLSHFKRYGEISGIYMDKNKVTF